MTTQGKKRNLHTGFSHEDTRRNNEHKPTQISSTDQYFLQVLGRLR